MEALKGHPKLLFFDFFSAFCLDVRCHFAKMQTDSVLASENVVIMKSAGRFCSKNTRAHVQRARTRTDPSLWGHTE